MSIYFQDERLTLLHGDALTEASNLPDGSVDCIVTSPPYFGLRDYGSEGQYGLEETPAEYVETMRLLFSELRRTLADDGTLWLNIGDSYASGTRKTYATHTGKHVGRGNPVDRKPSVLPAKNLLGIPWRVAFALQDDGWILRNAIIWHKPNAMPESVADRLSTRYEQFFMFSKSQKYWFDLDPIREELIYPGNESKQTWVRNEAKEQPLPGRQDIQKRDSRTYGKAAGTNLAPSGSRHAATSGKGKNPGDMWSINTQPFGGAHFAVMPQELARRAIVSGCKPGGTVMDPFSGSGTTGLAANENGRKYVGIDISADYLELSLKTRLQLSTIDFGAIA